MRVKTCFGYVEIFCPDLPSLGSIGSIKPHQSKWKVGDRATYQCNQGYELNGRKRLVCLSSGVWSVEPPKCQGYIKLSFFKWNYLHL